VSRPLIGVTLGSDSGRPGFYRLREDYLRSVEQAGGLPVALAPGSPSAAGELVDRLDGLLLSGGADVDPALYGEAPHPKTEVHRERDDFELALARAALAHDLPLLAICRGQQVLNVAAGGTLVQDIPSQVAGSRDHNPDVPRAQTAHEVRLVAGTRLQAILGGERAAVNSFHHQAVGAPGQGVVVSAVCDDDQVIEGIELPSRRFAVGVQWHPESFWRAQPGFHALFAAHVEACR
jgi:putative glutamine amidotransferase